ncbi:Methionine-binding lipoprotein MetQ precursor [Paraliobacillus sp. PM-2]|uniref:MetQ/NlpA family ABC transporter substrate-binding protein n=1 Tax=Paraliobacillus sp. PM-2 TaxID=1462524 RepID=UPI00061BBF98|nr:MetQ/NlpA family ABC transporter substrate-binding protein [Paraliobacillus sp. PM-2]CQR46541.1 Methionine-binding lipoprotein MetQ precursor [Paraliobacillus sp. PM-2]
MKKVLLLLFIGFFAVVLAACGTEDSDSAAEGEGNTTIKVGATSVPHAEVLEQAKPLLAEKDIDLIISEYQDFILPNEDLSNGELDANYFQHIPYFESQVEDFDYDFVNLGGIHIEPMAVYSKNITSVDAIPEGTEVIISRSVPDHGRILALFEAQGLIKLDENVNKAKATIDDIVENPLDLTFSADVDAAVLPEMYEREEDALVAINTNYAIEAGLSPIDDSLFVEGSDSPYVNIVAARAEDENNEALLALVEVLQSDVIKNFITETYNGEVVPVNAQ